MSSQTDWYLQLSLTVSSKRQIIKCLHARHTLRVSVIQHVPISFSLKHFASEIKGEIVLMKQDELSS